MLYKILIFFLLTNICIADDFFYICRINTKGYVLEYNQSKNKNPDLVGQPKPNESIVCVPYVDLSTLDNADEIPTDGTPYLMIVNNKIQRIPKEIISLERKKKNKKQILKRLVSTKNELIQLESSIETENKDDTFKEVKKDLENEINQLELKLKD